MSNFDNSALPVHPLPLLAAVGAGISLPTLFGIWTTVSEMLAGVNFGSSFADGLRAGSVPALVILVLSASLYAVCAAKTSDLAAHQIDLVLRLLYVVDLLAGAALLCWGLSELGVYVDFIHTNLTLPVVFLAAPLMSFLLIGTQIGTLALVQGEHSSQTR